MRALPLFALALVLAGCGQPSGTPEAGGEPGAPPAPAATPATAPDAPTANTIPARFHGLWDGESGTCQPDSDLRLDIGPQSIGFYESQGTVTAVDARDPDVVSVQLAMEGEGDQWAQTLQLALEGEGGNAILHVRYLPDPEDEELSGRAGTLSQRFQPCPA